MLDGIRVVDLTQNIAGPYCTQMLADLGADVIKIEPPTGDPARQWGPPFWEGEAPIFLSSNRGKRGIVVDLKSDGGRDVLERLVDSADIFVQSFRTGVIDSLGFGAERLRAQRPELIYASISGFGPKGPFRESPGYDPLMQAYSGIMSMTGYPDGPPARVAGAVVDLGTGMLTALGIVAALRERDKTGKGRHVEACLLDTSIGWISYHLMGYLATGEVPGRLGTALGMVVPYEGFATKDGHLIILGGNDAIFVRLCEALNLSDAAEDERFKTNPSRVAHRDELHQLLEARTKEFTTADLRALLEKHRVPCAPVHDVSEVVDDPQIVANGIFAPHSHPRIPDYRDVPFPVRFDGERPPRRDVPPLMGEHSREVLAELSYSQEQIDSLAAGGSIGLGSGSKSD